jgi:YidC/Oxa1 family membrane protein insertase
MESLRFIIALIICFLIIYLWGAFFQPPRAVPPPRPAVPEARPQAGNAERPEAPAGQGGEAAKPAAPEALEPEKTETVVVSGGKSGKVLELKLSSRAGGIYETLLPDFKKRDQTGPEVLIAEEPGRPSVLGLWVEDAGVSFDREKGPLANWSLELPPALDTAYLRREVAGLSITKEIKTESGKYHADVGITFENRSGAPKQFHYRLQGPGRITTESPHGTGEDLNYLFAERRGEGLSAEVSPVSSIQKQKYWQNPNPAAIELIGASNNYFASVMVAADEKTFSQLQNGYAEAYLDPLRASEVSLKEHGRPFDQLAPAQREEVEKKVYFNVRTGFISREKITLQPGEQVTHRFVVFLGPRDPQVLQKDTPFELTTINYYGLWTPLVKLFIVVLEGLHFIFRTWGLAIMGLTFLVRLALHPLSRKQQASMMRYQKKIAGVQPQLNALKEKYAGNRMKMNQEMQALFKEHGINPSQMMGGCLLIFLQLPVWYALYNTIQYCLDLRHARFLWIKDLTLPDRLIPDLGFTVPIAGWHELNLLPFIYVTLTIIQQKLQPKPTDPQMQQQMKMMTFMLVFFGFIFYSFPAGFLLYFITGACISMIESRIIKKSLAREGLGPLPPAGGPMLTSPSVPGGFRPPALYPARKPGEKKQNKKK